MAIDTTEKKLALLTMGVLHRSLPVGDGSFDTGDLQHLLRLYSGIAAAANQIAVGVRLVYVGWGVRT